MKIQDPVSFWSELMTRFMASMDLPEQKIILMTLCVLYNENSEQLQEMKTIPYWLKLIEHAEYLRCHFLMLQLLYIALSVKQKELAKANMLMLIKANGLFVLHNAMNMCFKDLNPERLEKHQALQSAIKQFDNQY